MEVVLCPHCSTEIANDGSLAEQVVSCPSCGGHFQMPLLHPTQSQSPGWDEEEDCKAEVIQLKRRCRQAKQVFDATGCITLLCVTGGFFVRICIFWQANQDTTDSTAFQWNIGSLVFYAGFCLFFGLFTRSTLSSFFGALGFGFIATLISVYEVNPAPDLLMSALFWVPIASFAYAWHRHAVAERDLRMATSEASYRDVTRCPKCKAPYAKECVSSTPVDSKLDYQIRTWTEKTTRGGFDVDSVEKTAPVQVQLWRYHNVYQCRYCHHSWEEMTGYR